MSKLPQNESQSSSTPTKSKKSKRNVQSFPSCIPLSPNSASLRGFRMLLLQRKKLTEKVAGSKLDKESFRNTPMYDALNKRFQSVFIWPVFLATFMPRHVEETENIILKKIMTPSKLPNFNFNKSMMTPRKRLNSIVSSSSSTLSSPNQQRPQTLVQPVMNSPNSFSNGKAPSILQRLKEPPHTMQQPLMQPRIVLPMVSPQRVVPNSSMNLPPISVLEKPGSSTKLSGSSTKLPNIETFSKSHGQNQIKFPINFNTSVVGYGKQIHTAAFSSSNVHVETLD